MGWDVFLITYYVYLGRTWKDRTSREIVDLGMDVGLSTSSI